MDTIKKLVNGKLIEMAVSENKKFQTAKTENENSEIFSTELLDRSRINEDMKIRLGEMLKNNEELLPIVEVLIGSAEAKAFLEE